MRGRARPGLPRGWSPTPRPGSSTTRTRARSSSHVRCSACPSGEPSSFESPKDAYAAGICMVHQNFRLVDRLSVAENVVLGWSPRREWRYSRRRSESEVAGVAAQLGIHVNPAAPVGELTVGERQRVEILKALYRGARILILDEPTTVLTPHECDGLFEILRRLAHGGTSIVFISHKLPEVIALCDRTTVLRRGCAVGTEDLGNADIDVRGLAHLMVGRTVAAVTRNDRPNVGRHPVLEIDRLAVTDAAGSLIVDDVSLTVDTGELVGIAGVAGNGQHALAETIAGLRRPSTGVVRVAGTPIRLGDPRHAIETGVGYVPQDRMAVGLAAGLSLMDNLILKSFCEERYARGPFIRSKRVRANADALMKEFDIRGNAESSARVLSGGNAQKVVLAREFSGRPAVLVAETPTRGLDIGAANAVRHMLVDKTKEGLGILLISEDLDELLEICDRIVVMYRGRLTESRAPKNARRDEVGMMMGGANP